MNLKSSSKDWMQLEPWWNELIGGSAPELYQFDLVPLARQQLMDQWTELDAWWDHRATSISEQRTALRNVFAEFDTMWAASSSRLSADPLSAEWYSNGRGPLRTNQEENWSQWLAHLLREWPALTQHVLGLDLSNEPRSVQRETQLIDPDDGSIRYPDILVKHDNIGIHIEVKIDDEGYGKTPHTAKLVEYHFPNRTWYHVLLIPGRQRRAVENSFLAEELLRNGELVIQRSGYPPITVHEWEDISHSIRVLFAESEPSGEHVHASAFTFCALIEQKIIGCLSQTTIEQESNPLVYSNQSLTEQLSYLSSCIESVNNG